MSETGYTLEIHPTWGDDFMQTIDITLLLRGDDGVPYEVGMSLGPRLGEVVRYADTRNGIMTRKGAQWLMDRLWEMGIRPKDEATPGQLQAVKAHLSDMQLIAFRFMDRFLEFNRKEE